MRIARCAAETRCREETDLNSIAMASGALLVASLGAHLALSGPGLANDHGEELTIFSGVFTEAQAERGKVVYNGQCAACHGNTGRGGPSAPGVTGHTLNSKYRGVPLGVYFHFLQTTMPIGRPGSLPVQTYADVMAYMLQMHGAPAGESELTADEDLLAAIMIERDPNK